MKFRIAVIAVADDGTECRQELVTLTCTETEAKLETIGLTLAAGKEVLQSLQQIVIERQVDVYLDQQRACPHCGKKRRLKQGGLSPFRTLFGLVEVDNPRWRHCNCRPCQPHFTKTLRPLAALLPERTSPELLYLETKWASLASYGITSKLLHEVLPIDHKHSEVTVRNHTFRMAWRNEQMIGAEQAMFAEGCQAEWDRLPIPDGPLSVGLDGGIVRARRGTSTRGTTGVAGGKTSNLFEVIAGKSILSFRRDDHEDAPTPASSKCSASVQSFDKKPKRRLFDLLQSQGMQANQQMTFFSDGGDTVRTLPEYLNPQADHILDWFHLTMKITVLQQCARGLSKPKPPCTDCTDTDPDADCEESIERRLESVKHYLWQGNRAKALDGLREVEDDLECWGCDPSWNWVWEEESEKKTEKKPQSEIDSAAPMLKYVRELDTYIVNNAGSIVNYGERCRNGERISTGFVESTINQVVSKRMVKKQQMQWTPEGAHLLLQERTQVLNDDWEDTFRTWYPNFRPE